MKNFLGFMMITSFSIAASAWATPPTVTLKNSEKCIGQEAELQSAMKLDPTLSTRLPHSSDGTISVMLSGPTEDPYLNIDGPITDGEMRSSPFGGGDWNLNPGFVDGKCIPVKAADIAESVSYWKKNLYKVPTHEISKTDPAAKIDNVANLTTAKGMTSETSRSTEASTEASKDELKNTTAGFME
jgi:hypothetical protein